MPGRRVSSRGAGGTVSAPPVRSPIDCSIIVASFGTEGWRQLALRRAVPSTEGQGAREVLVRHERHGNIATVRNAAAAEAKGRFLCFVDADDELAPGYLEAMSGAGGGAKTLLTPRVSYVGRRGTSTPRFHDEIDMRVANWIVIGTLVPRRLFLKVGGFADRPDFGAFEDWELWIRCLKAGAEIIKVPDAIYVAHIERTSRHRVATPRRQRAWHYAIGREHYPDLYGPNWPGVQNRLRRRVRAT